MVAVENRGLTVSEMTELRVSARKAENVLIGVYRNTLARRAVLNTAFACLNNGKVLTGPIVLFFSQDEPGAAAKIVRDFSKTHENFLVRALALDGKLLGPDQLQAVASLPSREEALAQLLAVLQAPITKFVRTLAEPYAQAVRVVKAVSDQRQAA